MGKRKVGGYKVPTPNVLLVDRHTSLASNDLVHDSPYLVPIETWPHVAKSTRHIITTWRWRRLQLAPMQRLLLISLLSHWGKLSKSLSTMHLDFYTLEDKLITCNNAKKWLALQRTQEFAKLQREVVVDLAATCYFHSMFTSPIWSHVVAWSSSLMCKSTCETNSMVGWLTSMPLGLAMTKIFS